MQINVKHTGMYLRKTMTDGLAALANSSRPLIQVHTFITGSPVYAYFSSPQTHCPVGMMTVL